MNLSRILNPTYTDDQGDASRAESQPASTAGPSNHGDIRSRPGSDLPQPGRYYPPIFQAPVNSQSSAIMVNQPSQLAVGPTSQEWPLGDRPVKTCEPLAFGRRKGCIANSETAASAGSEATPIRKVKMISQTGASRMYSRKKYLEYFGDTAAESNWFGAKPHMNLRVPCLAYPLRDKDTSTAPIGYPTSVATFNEEYATALASGRGGSRRVVQSCLPTADWEKTTWGPGTE
jgi:hypothetical protein